MTEPEIDFDAVADELAIIELWDGLPDYCRTTKFWQQIVTMCPTALLHKLKPIDNKEHNTNG